jgi:predicted metal-dependent phosphoesterase TrpH
MQTPITLDDEVIFRASEKQLDKLPPEEAEQLETVGAVVEKVVERPVEMMKIDLHCHTEASHDCSTPIKMFPQRCQARQVAVQAITDHNQIWGAQELKALVEEEARKNEIDLKVIVGEEITTTEGEIIGLFLTEKIEPGISPEESVAEIKSQGGLVYLPHGFDPLKRWRLQPAARERIAEHIDIVETFNARISRPRWNRAAVTWANERGVLMGAGSDAHTLADVGSAWVEVPNYPIHDPKDLLRALDGGLPSGDWTHPVIAYAYKLYDRARRSLRTRRR